MRTTKNDRGNLGKNTNAVSETQGAAMSKIDSVVVGATGLVGSHVLQELAAQKINTLVIARREISPLPNNVCQIVTDFDDFLANGTVPPCEHIYLCLGTTIKSAGSQAVFRKIDFDYNFNFAVKAQRAGALGLSLVSAVGASTQSKNFYLRTKGELEQAISALNFPQVNIYRPGLLIGERTSSRIAEGLGQHMSKLIDPILIGGLRKYRSIQAEKLARAMVNKSHNSSGHKTFYFDDFF